MRDTRAPLFYGNRLSLAILQIDVAIVTSIYTSSRAISGIYLAEGSFNFPAGIARKPISIGGAFVPKGYWTPMHIPARGFSIPKITLHG